MTLCCLGSVQSNQNNFAEAEVNLKRAVELDKDNVAAVAQRCLVDVYEAQERYQEALSLAMLVCELDPKDDEFKVRIDELRAKTMANGGPSPRMSPKGPDPGQSPRMSPKTSKDGHIANPQKGTGGYAQEHVAHGGATAANVSAKDGHLGASCPDGVSTVDSTSMKDDESIKLEVVSPQKAKAEKARESSVDSASKKQPESKRDGCICCFDR